MKKRVKILIGPVDIASKLLNLLETRTLEHLIYNKATGGLFYDSDGTGSHAPVQLATLTNKAAINASDFFVI